MTGGPFGRSGPGLMQRLRPCVIYASELRAVADVVLPALARPDLRLTVRDRPSGGAVLLVEEGEHRLVARLGDLADDMTRAGVRDTFEGMAAALTEWVASRPVTQAAAAAEGVAVLDWVDPARTGLAWRIVVRRGDVVQPWFPEPDARPGTVRRLRAAAVRRAASAGGRLHVEGPVALWSHAVPMLTTAALAEPERLVALVGEAGLVLPDMHVVVTPSRPVACAAPAVAARLAGQASEERLVLPWRRLRELPWL